MTVERAGQQSCDVCDLGGDVPALSHKRQENREDCLKPCPVYSYQGREHFAVRIKFCALMHTECVLSSTAVLLTQVQTLEE